MIPDKNKKERLLEIKKSMRFKTYQDYETIINEGIITKKDMIDAGIITDKSIERLRCINQNDRVIDLSKPNYNCPPQCTDVYFFGETASGITCLNMGLLASSDFKWVHNDYGQGLMELCKRGLTPALTSGDFASITTGVITDSKNEDVKHFVNIIDMAGVAFSKKIADNPDGKVKFADMWLGITDMLLNDNEKIFFLLIDPTSETIEVRYEENSDGGTSLITVYQEDTLLRFLSLFEDDNNKKVLEKVKAIHVIMTKSDRLGEDADEREERAVKIIDEKYGQLKKKLCKLCKDNSINLTTNYKPLLFTFSLGKFYYGSIFEYDSTDSDKLLKFIATMTPDPKPKKWYWYHKITKFFN